jgi:glucose/arabinose dehydrogenase
VWRRVCLVALPAAVVVAAAAGCGGGGGDGSADGASAAPITTTRVKGVRLKRIGSFSSPVYVAGAPGDPSRLFVVERAGRIRVIRNGHRVGRPFLDIHKDVSTKGERGLLSMAFAPDYQTSGLLYVYYTDRRGDIRIQQLRRSGNANVAVANSRRDVLRVPHSSQTNHDGGQLQFGPDGYLYAGFGDGGGEGDPYRTGQRLNTLLAKLVRIDPRPGGGYRVPKDNPFVGRAGARREIWAYGLRNPYRFSFDRLTGDLTIGDVGQNEFEEIDFQPKGAGRGANYGWSVFEGFHRYRSGSAAHAVKPKLAPTHRAGFCALIGGYVVRDTRLKSLYGRYVYGDNCKPEIFSTRLASKGASSNHPTGLRVSSVSSFGEDTQGRVYVASLNGAVYRFVPG